ncbi:MAG: hypothetical protein IPQ09_07510 [Myxococcales bacterium]|nr:hypothetical protein [Myxococcales bacterium]
MALFPKCTFEFFLSSGGGFVAGERNEGTLVLHVPEAIPRAEHLFMNLHTAAWAGYGSGKNRSVHRRELLNLPMRVDLPATGMPAGRHSYPFALDVPAWLPPGFAGNDCAVEHELRARLDVDWALDPHTTVRPVVHRPPERGARATTVVRSPRAFHDALVLELTLPSVVTVDEPIDGQLALRAGMEAKFDAIVLTLAKVSRITMARGDLRRQDVTEVVLRADQVRAGEPIAFRFPPSGEAASSFSSGYIDLGYAVYVRADIPWGFDPEFSVPVRVLPSGSVLEGEESAVVLGGERLRRVAAFVAARTGLTPGRAPVIASGVEGPVTFAIEDAPRGGDLGVEAILTFPALGVDLRLRALGILEGFRDSPLLPPELRTGYLLRCDAPRGRYATEPLGEATFHDLLSDLGAASSLRMSDHHLAFHFIVEDDAERIASVAAFVANKAKRLSAAIAAMPFPTVLEAARFSWEGAARERGGVLVPSNPAIVGVSVGVRTLAGEERHFRLSVTTEWQLDATPRVRLDVDLGELTLPPHVAGRGDERLTHPLLTSLRGVLDDITVDGARLVRAHAPFPGDPRPLFAAGEVIAQWALELRGERRVDAPYR